LTPPHRRAVARIDLDAIAANFRALGQASGKRVLAVVKADAYGHGAAAVAGVLEAAGADFFCVAIAEEGASLRRAGIRSPILLLSFSDARDAAFHRALGLTPTLSSLAQAREFAEATRAFARPLRVHLEVDAGLTRLGILPGEISEAAAILNGAPGLEVEGVFTHFSHGDEPESPEMERQEAVSREVFAALRAAGIAYSWTHLANSGAVLAGKGLSCDAIKPGLSLYGVCPGTQSPPVALKPALSWETEVIAVKEVPPG
jgi:alanine racemase